MSALARIEILSHIIKQGKYILPREGKKSRRKSTGSDRDRYFLKIGNHQARLTADSESW